MSGDTQVSELIALDDSLTNMTALANHTLVHFAVLDTNSEAIPLFDDNLSTNWIAGFRIQKINDGGFVYIAGRPYRYDNSSSYQNYNYIIDNWLNFIPVNVDDETPAGSVNTYKLFQNYPNPFNPSTKISYSIPETDLVTLKVYDVLGNEVATLVSENKPVGSYEIEFDGSELTSGVYFYRLQAGSFIETKKMILMK
jgi:hypothetical protein